MGRFDGPDAVQAVNGPALSQCGGVQGAWCEEGEREYTPRVEADLGIIYPS